jgi:N-acetylmuramoyl-L-alanine amidase
MTDKPVTKLNNKRLTMDKISTYNRKVATLLLFSALCMTSVFAQNTTKERPTIKTIVIDAGHGGKDPGCHGAAANEKSVCLTIALKLGDLIKKKFPEIKVVYTRDKDVFVELDERANIANKAKADLFICIHANAASPSAYGAETYVLGLHRTESQQHVAERENATIFLEDDKGEKYKEFDMSPDALIARQIQLAVFLDQSILFAEKLQKEFKSIGRYDRGVRQAGFLVLYKTTMPSVLIETGFLTNPNEEKFLADADGQTKMANSMFAAFEKYKNELEGVDGQTTNTSQVTENDVQEKPETDPSSIPADNVVFRVQIETSSTKIAATSSRFKGFQVFEYLQDNLFKYTVGTFVGDYKSANDYKNKMREEGFVNAFVVAFLNGERINLEKAVKLAQK